ncbi:5-hydroxytryptamine receptor 1E isoform X2 [Rhincodon typus]|uniref:5-hydroxytryptamine receptor 1E isoform X2 n=1 Tax=Rhincodon typus TaxID=259920 RepID=UPI00202F559F|nr:5-hydroxytryptamine receptor 1E isoform X2 [Rhincodon typus]
MNFSNCTNESCQGQSKTLTERTAIALILSLIAIMTTLLNSAVMVAICITKKLHQPANYLICSLALTDLLVAILVMPISITYITTDAWVLGYIVCEAWLSLDMTFCTCSILHLCVIALDRYWAITDAVEYTPKRTAKRAGVMILTVWTISVFISMPPLFWRSHNVNSTGEKCIIQHDHVIYTIYSTFGAFYVPSALILILYYRIYHAAKNLYQKRGSSRHFTGRKSESQISTCMNYKLTQTFCVSNLHSCEPVLKFHSDHRTCRVPTLENRQGSTEERQQNSNSRERNAARILGLILGTFVFCWLPFFIKELCVGLHLWVASQVVTDFLAWLGYINSLINPLLYTSFNEDFKLAFRKLIRRKPP